MRGPGLTLGWFVAFMVGCPQPPAPAPDGGIVCPANTELTPRGTCQCQQGYAPNLAGTACILAPRVDAGALPDAGVLAGDAGEACALMPYPESQSRLDFAASLEEAVVSCSSCHRAGQAPVFDATAAHDVIVTRIEEGATSASETTAGRVLRVDDAQLGGHPYPFSAAPAAKSFIEAHLFGVLPPGCE